MTSPASVGALASMLAEHDYLAPPSLATTLYLGLVLHKPVLLEGEAGVGKTEVAKALAAALGRTLIRLQCYEGLDVASAVVAMDAHDCKGKFASARNSELVDSDVVFRGFSSCEDSDGPRLSQYFIVSRKKGGFVLFSVLSNMKTEEAKTVAKDERLADFRKAALVVVDH